MQNQINSIEDIGQSQNSSLLRLGPDRSIRNNRQPPAQGSHESTQGNIQQQPVSPAVGVSLIPSSTTTQAGLPRQRIKWTGAMNEQIFRSYLKVTNLGNQVIGYRQQIHQLFIQKFPQFNHLTEQRIADQRRAIERNNLISEPTRQRITTEVEFEIQFEDSNQSNNIAETLEISIPAISSPSTTREGSPIQDNHHILRQNSELNQHHTPVYEDDIFLGLNEEFNVALIEYQGSDPTCRPKLPRQNTTLKLTLLTTIVN
jgi:hypothetical protein